jgi:hypothetical protein
VRGEDDWQLLTPEQIRNMCWAQNPTTKKNIELSHTGELECDYRAWLRDECQHESVNFQHVIYADGKGSCVRKQCATCGKAFGLAVSKSSTDIPDEIETVSIDKHSKYEKSRLDALRELKLKHFQIQNDDGQLKYEAYLQSDKWNHLRKRIMARAKGICEGCAERPPSQVHHLTYSHKYTELMWELVAVCDECHAKAHGK